MRTCNRAHTLHVPHIGVFQGEFDGKKRVDVFWLLTREKRGKEAKVSCGRGKLDKVRAYQIQHDFTQQRVLQSAEYSFLRLYFFT